MFFRFPKERVSLSFFVNAFEHDLGAGLAHHGERVGAAVAGGRVFAAQESVESTGEEEPTGAEFNLKTQHVPLRMWIFFLG